MTAKRKTCKRYNDAGHAHALTFSCFHGLPLLTRERSCQWVINALKLARGKHAFDLWAYVLMPEHVHLLIWPTRAEYRISALLATIKQSVHHKALAFLRANAPEFLPRLLDQQPNGKQHYRFWQRGGGHDRNITEPTTVWAEIEYIHANPARRGLCTRPEEWPWSSAADHSGARPG